MTTILVIAEHDQKKIKPATLHAITAATLLNGDIDLLIAGEGCEEAANHARGLSHLKKILLANHQVYAHGLAENLGQLIASFAEKYDYVLTASSTFSKNCLPYAAALLDVNMLSDVTEIISPDTFVRPIYAGNVLATIQTTEKIKMMTVRATAFPAVQLTDASHAELVTVSEVFENKHTQFESAELTKSVRPELSDARVVVSGGRALKSGENFKLIEALADTLHAAIGASRAAVDAGFVPNDYQVGQTGKVVAPDLYIAIGISGAIQHLAGMKDSKIVVAINNDPDAPIFESADYGLVGDLFEIVPALQMALQK